MHSDERRSYLAHISRRRRYASCTKCSKKCIGEDGAGFSCEACGWTGDKCTYRYILQMAIQDATSTGYVTAFNEQAASILGKSADELKALKDVSQACTSLVCFINLAHLLHTPRSFG